MDHSVFIPLKSANILEYTGVGCYYNQKQPKRNKLEKF